MSKGGPLNEYGLSVKRETFAQLLATGQYTQSDAYREVFTTQKYTQEMVHRKASELANEQKVKDRVAMLREPVLHIFRKKQEQMANAIVDATEATVGKGNPDHNVRIKAAKTGLDYLGYEAPKKNLNLNANVEMTQEDVNKLLEGL